MGSRERKAVVGDGHAVGVASQVVQDGVGSDDRSLGEDDPAASAHLAQQGREGAGVLEGLALSMELEFSGSMELEQAGAELALEHAGDSVHGEEPAGLFGTGPGALGGEAAASDQAVEVGMVHEVLSPGVEDGREAQLRLEALLAELEERGAGALKEQAVERGLVLEDERAQGSGEGEDPVEIADGQERAPLLLEPLAAALVLAGGAVAVAAAVGPPMGAVTLLALPHRPAQLSGATLGQTAQHLEVMSGQGLSVEVFGQEYLEDLGDRQLRRGAGGAAHAGIKGDLRSSNPRGL